MRLSRRSFLKISAGAPLGCLARTSIFADDQARLSPTLEKADDGFGRLTKDSRGILDLPKGFSYEIVAEAGDKMSDGFYAPGLADGMRAFPGPGGFTALFCHHEFRIGHPDSLGPFGGKKKALQKLKEDTIYDKGKDGKPCLGSTTAFIYDTRRKRLKAHFLCSVGTLANCAGEVTPWNTALTCEEVVVNPGGPCSERHGYVFEMPLFFEPHLVKPRPLKALGRFQHEGVAVVPPTGLLYETEDQVDGLFYRFIPEKSGLLTEDGRLQCLGIAGKPRYDTRNWKKPTISPAEVLPVEWIDVEDVDPDQDDLRLRGQERGGALFAGAEGIVFHNGDIYFDCTNGGRSAKGQIWRYRPSAYEGTGRERESPGRLELLIEPNDETIMDHPDQMTMTPWGDLFACEDGDGDNYLLGITPRKNIYKFALNALNESDLSGVCFSPDGGTMFLNILEPGITLAITGPWTSSPGKA